MKKMKLLSIMAFCAAVMAFTSCDTGTSSAWTPLTPTEKAACFSQVAGTYNGKMMYYSVSDSAKSATTDTLKVSWTIGTGLGADTTVTVNNIPVAIIAKYISEEKVSKALATYKGTMQLKSPMYFYQTSPAAFLLQPEEVKCPITYDGGSHTISLYFYQSSISAVTSYGFYNTTQKALRMDFLLGGYKLDATDNSSKDLKTLSYKVNNRSYTYAPLVFVATK